MALAVGLGLRGTATAGAVDLVRSATAAWHHEADRTTDARVETVGTEPSRAGVVLRFTLGSGPPGAQFAAAVVSLPAGVEGRRITIDAHADRPMRVAVQFRERGHANPRRWRRTMYVDAHQRSESFPLDAFTPLPPGDGPMPASTIDALLLGVDTVNTRPGTTGVVTFTAVRVEP